MLLVVIGALVGLTACAPQKGRTIRPVVTVNSVVGGPTGTTIVSYTRPEDFVGESMGFTQEESACMSAALEAKAYPESYFYAAPDEATKEAILGLMGECLRNPAAYGSTTVSGVTSSVAPTTPTTPTPGATP